MKKVPQHGHVLDCLVIVRWRSCSWRGISRDRNGPSLLGSPCTIASLAPGKVGGLDPLQGVVRHRHVLPFRWSGRRRHADEKCHQHRQEECASQTSWIWNDDHARFGHIMLGDDAGQASKRVIDAVVFDLDGTLPGTMSASCAIGWNRVARPSPHSLPPITESANIVRAVTGKPHDESHPRGLRRPERGPSSTWMAAETEPRGSRVVAEPWR